MHYTFEHDSLYIYCALTAVNIAQRVSDRSQHYVFRCIHMYLVMFTIVESS
jgi:hypothetical protein